MNSESDLCKKADFSLKISERISLINKDLAPVTHIRKLSNKPVIDRQLFESMDQEDVVKLAVKLVSQLDDVKVLLRDCRTVLEDIETLPPLDPSPQISSQISDLQCKLDDFVLNKPEPLDYSKIASEMAKSKPVQEAFRKVPAPQARPVNAMKQARQVADITARNSNLMIYNAPICSSEANPYDLAVWYLKNCGVDSIEALADRVVDAQYVKILDKQFCHLRVVMKNQWVVNAVLKDAKLLKDGNIIKAWDNYKNTSYRYDTSYISRDRTITEQEERRKLVIEQKEKIASDSSKRWVIKYGKVLAVGEFIPFLQR